LCTFFYRIYPKENMLTRPRFKPKDFTIYFNSNLYFRKLDRRKKGPQSSAALNDNDVDGDFDDEDSAYSVAEPAVCDTNAKEEVYSMSEIASCSYEARKVKMRPIMAVVHVTLTTVFFQCLLNFKTITFTVWPHCIHYMVD
jgi:hypothetical protein